MADNIKGNSKGSDRPEGFRYRWSDDPFLREIEQENEEQKKAASAAMPIEGLPYIKKQNKKRRASGRKKSSLDMISKLSRGSMSGFDLKGTKRARGTKVIEKDKELAILKRELEKNSVVIKKEESALLERIKGVDSDRKRLEKSEADFLKEKEALKKYEASLREEKKKIDEKAKNLEKEVVQIKRIRESVSAKQASAEKRLGEIENSERELKRKEAVIKSYIENASKRSAELEKKEVSLDKKQEEQKNYMETILKKTGELDRRKTALDKRESELKRLDIELNTKRSELARIESRMKAREAAISRSAAANEKNERNIEEKKAKVADALAVAKDILKYKNEIGRLRELHGIIKQRVSDEHRRLHTIRTGGATYNEEDAPQKDSRTESSIIFDASQSAAREEAPNPSLESQAPALISQASKEVYDMIEQASAAAKRKEKENAESLLAKARDIYEKLADEDPEKRKLKFRVELLDREIRLAFI